MRIRRIAASAAVALLTSACLSEPTPSAVPSNSSQSSAEPVYTAEGSPDLGQEADATPSPATVPRVVLLHAASGGDGDSWKDTAGREYRLGLVNTPEFNECYGSEATAKRKDLVAGGFRAAVYTTDKYGRSVAVVTTANGTNVNIWLARHGFANDKYLSTFRAENPGLATQLDAAFAAAKSERTGLWSACGYAAAAAPKPAAQAAAAGGNCDAAYPTVCIAPPPPDLDCGDIPYRRFKVLAPDPHHFDADHDGIGCESG